MAGSDLTQRERKGKERGGAHTTHKECVSPRNEIAKPRHHCWQDLAVQGKKLPIFRGAHFWLVFVPFFFLIRKRQDAVDYALRPALQRENQARRRAGQIVFGERCGFVPFPLFSVLVRVVCLFFDLSADCWFDPCCLCSSRLIGFSQKFRVSLSTKSR